MIDMDLIVNTIIIFILSIENLRILEMLFYSPDIWAATYDFQQCGILTSVDWDENVQPPFQLRNSKCCLVSSLTVIEYLSDKQRLWWAT